MTKTDVLRAPIDWPVRYFTPREFRCRCACGKLGPFNNPWGMSPILLIWLDNLRAAWGKPVIVTSGFRCLAHNIEVAGAKDSRHLAGLAADIKPNDPALISPFKLLATEMAANFDGWEVIEYPTFMHVASRRQ